MFQRAPWRDVDGDDVVLFDVVPGHGEPVAGTILGRLGEVFGLKIYENGYSLRYLIEVLEKGFSDSPTEFLHHRQMLSVEFVPAGELTKPDREFLRAMGHRVSPSTGTLQLRIGRPGFADWYPTEEEGQRLLYFLEAVVWLGETHGPAQLSALADRPKWPCVRRVESGGFRLDWMSRPQPPAEKEEPTVIPPRELIDELTQLKNLRGGGGPVLEMEIVNTSLRVGRPSERPGFTTVMLIVDAQSGAVLKPELFAASDAAGPHMVRIFADFARKIRACPVEVRHYGSLTPMKPLFDAVGIRLQKCSSLPAFGAAMDGLMKFLEG